MSDARPSPSFSPVVEVFDCTLSVEIRVYPVGDDWQAESFVGGRRLVRGFGSSREWVIQNVLPRSPRPSDFVMVVRDE